MARKRAPGGTKDVRIRVGESEANVQANAVAAQQNAQSVQNLEQEIDLPDLTLIFENALI